jgi:VWFA-related protein
MKSSIILSAVLAIAISAASSAAPQATPPAPQTPTIKAGTEEVLLDIVIRDKKGKPVNDIKPEDLTVFDNGAQQTATSFRLVQGKEAVSNTGATTTLDPLRQVRLVTLCFKALGEPTERLTAKKAAIELVKGDQGTNVYYSVVMINGRLLVLQQFTNDKDALVRAIERATTGGAPSQYVAESDRIKSDLRRYLGAPSGLGLGADAANAVNAPGAASATPNAAPAGGGSSFVQAKLTNIMLEMLRFDAAYQGDDTRLELESMKSLVSGLAGLPGRKTILYFTEGIYMPTNLDEMFKNLKSAANRANVTFYGLMVQGVRTGSTTSSARDQLNNATNDIKNDSVNGTGHVGATTDQLRAADTAETAGRNNTDLPLRELSEDTGGFLVGDSNDLKVPLRHINEEVSSYYELSYNPGIANYDGSFRKVKVDAGRKDLVVHTRNGYFALPPDLRGEGVQTFELPLLKAISDNLASKDVEYRAAGVLLQPRAEGTDTQVFVELPLRTLSPKTDPAKNTLSVHFAMAALIKNPTGEVVQKLTRDRSLTVTAEQLKAGNFTEKFSATIPAGKYSLETAVMDRESGKIGGQRSELIIAPRKGVAISSITPVKLYNPNAKPEPNEPFQYQNGTISPTLLNTLTVSSPDATLPLFFTVYQDASIAAKPTMEIEFLQGGNSLGKLPLPLADADAQGRIQTVFSVPAGKFPEGTFVIHAIAKQGDTTADTRTEITIKKS